MRNERDKGAEKQQCMATIMRRQCDEWRSQGKEERGGTQ